MDQISTLDGTTFLEDLTPFVCFLETFIPEQHLSVQ